jgi:PAS domain S-box-containing protein
MAELEMCIPHMKRLAEQRTDRIIETSPNGIVMLDERLNIISMNPAFRSFFMCTEAICGRPISYLMDPDPFEKLASGEAELVNTVVTHSRYNLVCHEILYALPEEKQYAGIFVNITKTRSDEEKLDKLRAQTVMQARELLEHQIRMAQTIAKFLGESTAQSEGLLEKLMLIAGDDAADSEKNGKLGMEWIKDIYTSK